MFFRLSLERMRYIDLKRARRRSLRYLSQSKCHLNVLIILLEKLPCAGCICRLNLLEVCLESLNGSGYVFALDGALQLSIESLDSLEHLAGILLLLLHGL
jgi:hypothetical protein